METLKQLCLGASVDGDKTYFNVWAPKAKTLEVLFDDGREPLPLTASDEGYFIGDVSGVGNGALYRYRVDGQGPFPDPASRFQPQGVHKSSQVVDPSRFHWQEGNWSGLNRDRLIIYELHVGTFSPEGTFKAVEEKLTYLRNLGITAIELMPLNDFPGQRNWGYDGVSLFAPARCYGTPDDLRSLIAAAHRLGLGVLIDVVYNHLGPDGNYTGCFSEHYVTNKHHSPWGDGINLDDAHNAHVRRFFIENALHWLNEYHADGLRLDATHALMDESPQHFLKQFAEEVRARASRSPILIAEDCRNEAKLIRAPSEGGWGYDAVWADDFHHDVRRLLAGDSEAYYSDYKGTTGDIATSLEQGWLYTGQFAPHFNGPRGSDPEGIPPQRFLLFLQNHDQIGNRAQGERLNTQIPPEDFRAATVLWLCAPQTPMLFMGQEWGASSPFLFFTDHNEELGKLITEGRRAEFKHFKAYADPAVQAKIPDPQAPTTFERSRLPWQESQAPEHRALLELHRELLRLRREDAVLGSTGAAHHAEALDENTVLLWRGEGTQRRLLVVRFKAGGNVKVSAPGFHEEPLLTTEDPAFAMDPKPIVVSKDKDQLHLQFIRPGAVLFKAGVNS